MIAVLLFIPGGVLLYAAWLIALWAERKEANGK
jgi:hypothetical protein